MIDPTLIERLKLCANLIDVHGCDSSAIFEAIMVLSSPPSTNAEKDAATYDALRRLDVSSPPSLAQRALSAKMRQAIAEAREHGSCGSIWATTVERWADDLDAAIREEANESGV